MAGAGLLEQEPGPSAAHFGKLDRLASALFPVHPSNDYNPCLEPGLPPLAERLACFPELARRLGPARVLWRYDPIILGQPTEPAFHLAAFARLCRELAGHTERVTLSLLAWYRKTRRRLAPLRAAGQVFREAGYADPAAAGLLAGLAARAADHGLAAFSCAAQADLAALGLAPGHCVDAGLVNRLWGFAPLRRAPRQAPGCGCAPAWTSAPRILRHDAFYCSPLPSQARPGRQGTPHDPAGRPCWAGRSPETLRGKGRGAPAGGPA